MKMSHPPGGFVRGERFEHTTRFVVDIVKELAKMGISVRVVNIDVLETAGFLNSFKPRVELLWSTHRCGKTTVRGWTDHD